MGKNRNARCAQCGKKNKKCVCAQVAQRSSRRWWIVFVFVVICVLGSMMWGPLTHRRTEAEGHSDRYKAMIHSYFAQFGGRDRWWLTTAPPIMQAEQISAEVAQMKAIAEQSERDMERCRDVNARTQAIFAAFPKLRPSIFAGGVSRQIVTKQSLSELEDVMNSGADAIELCYVPEDQQYFSGLQPTLAWYRSGWGAVMLRGMRAPPIVRSALIYHELGHALVHRQGRTSSTSHAMSDLWIEEEVEMHDLVETPVLNALTDGAFCELVDRIVARSSATATTFDLCESVTEADLRDCRTMLDMQQVGQSVAGTVLAQFFFAIAFRHADVNAEQPGPAKIAHYRWYVKNANAL